jgi:hypothetical protein
MSKRLKDRVDELERESAEGFVEVWPIERFYGEPCEPERITKRELQSRTLADFWKDQP